MAAGVDVVVGANDLSNIGWEVGPELCPSSWIPVCLGGSQDSLRGGVSRFGRPVWLDVELLIEGTPDALTLSGSKLPSFCAEDGDGLSGLSIPAFAPARSETRLWIFSSNCETPLPRS